MPLPFRLTPAKARITSYHYFLRNSKQKMSDRNALSHHILPTSAQLIGVCMTVISVVKLLHLKDGSSTLNGLLVLDTIFFLISATLSYTAMRKSRLARFEKYADLFFMFGLVLLTICAILLGFELY